MSDPEDGNFLVGLAWALVIWLALGLVIAWVALS